MSRPERPDAPHRGDRGDGGDRGDRGAVTAEAALVLPILAVFALGLAWLVSLGVAQVRVTDAAREAARVLARGEPIAQAALLGRQVAPAGATVQVQRGGDTVRVRVQAPVRGPAGLFRFLPAFRVQGESVAAREPSS